MKIIIKFDIHEQPTFDFRFGMVFFFFLYRPTSSAWLCLGLTCVSFLLGPRACLLGWDGAKKRACYRFFA